MLIYSLCCGLRYTIIFECLDVIKLHRESKFTTLLFLKRLLDLLQVGQKADVCADLQMDQKSFSESTLRGRFITAEFHYKPLEGNIFLHVFNLPCEQQLPNWPGWKDSLCPPYDCMSVQSPGRPWEGTTSSRYFSKSLLPGKQHHPYLGLAFNSSHNNFPTNCNSSTLLPVFYYN